MPSVQVWENSKVEPLKSPSPARAPVTVKSPSSTAAGSAAFCGFTAVDFWFSSGQGGGGLVPHYEDRGAPDTTPAGLVGAVVVSSLRVAASQPEGAVVRRLLTDGDESSMCLLVRSWLTSPRAVHPGWSVGGGAAEAGCI